MFPRIWTFEEETLLVEMREGEGASYEEIAAAIGCAPATVIEKYKKICRTGETGANAKKNKRDLEEKSDAASRAYCRREEHAAATGDVTAVFFGDPLPGRSALDRMRARQ